MILLAKKSVSERKMSGGAAAGNYILTEVKYKCYICYIYFCFNKTLDMAE